MGGYAHIIGLYRHHNRQIPHLKALVETVLKLQREDGAWFHLPGASYMDFDALYALWLATEMESNLRPRVEQAARKYADFYLPILLEKRLHITGAVHLVLCNLTTLAILQRILPERFISSSIWGDIFDTRSAYQLDQILPANFRS